MDYFGRDEALAHLCFACAEMLSAVASGSDGVTLIKKLVVYVQIDGHKDDIVAAARQFAPNGLDAALITAGPTPQPTRRSLRYTREDASLFHGDETHAGAAVWN